MSVLFQHLLFISFNLCHAKAHVQHHEYIITYMILQNITIFYKTSKNELHCARRLACLKSRNIFTHYIPS